jgi:putative chitinase
MRPIDVVSRLCPRATPGYAAAFENGDRLLVSADITTPRRLAHFLAQVFHETGGLSIERESGNYSAARLIEIFGAGHHSAAVTAEEAQRLAHNGPAIFERVYGLGNAKKAAELGNTLPGDGFKYRGGGLLQTTGRGNYRRMGQKCGVDFEGSPELVVSAAHALGPALAEWREGNLNSAADRDDLRAITRKINGGYNGLAERQAWLVRIESVLQSVELRPAVSIVPAAKPSRAAAKGSAAVITGAGTVAAAQQAGWPWWAWIMAAAVAAIVAIAIVHFFFTRKDT